MTANQGGNPVKPTIHIYLLLFRDGIGHIDQSTADGHISADDAHHCKNKLAAIYADAIAHLVEERCQ